MAANRKKNVMKMRIAGLLVLAYCPAPLRALPTVQDFKDYLKIKQAEYSSIKHEGRIALAVEERLGDNRWGLSHLCSSYVHKKEAILSKKDLTSRQQEKACEYSLYETMCRDADRLIYYYDGLYAFIKYERDRIDIDQKMYALRDWVESRIYPLKALQKARRDQNFRFTLLNQF